MVAEAHRYDDDPDEKTLARTRAAEEWLRRAPPPRCLAGFRLGPSTLQDVTFDGHGSPLNKIYRLACNCGHDRFYALGHPLAHRPSIFVGPLALECAACGKVTELFDAARHGYDAEMGQRGASVPDSEPRTRFACDECGACPMTAHARFEHFSSILVDGLAAFAGKEHDLFTWFTLVGECDGCHDTLFVADFECA